jgi:hypothetical protein
MVLSVRLNHALVQMGPAGGDPLDKGDRLWLESFSDWPFMVGSFNETHRQRGARSR